MSLTVKRYILQPLFVNTYLLYDNESKESAVIDPGENIGGISRFINNEKLHLKYIINTHLHFDHCAGNAKLKSLFPDAQICSPKLEQDFVSDPAKNSSSKNYYDLEPFAIDNLIDENSSLNLGEVKLQIISIPGHTRGQSAILAENAIFSGDMVFKNGVGRTDLFSGDPNALDKSLARVEALTEAIPNVAIYPGHGPSFSQQHFPHH